MTLYNYKIRKITSYNPIDKIQHRQVLPSHCPLDKSLEAVQLMSLFPNYNLPQ